MANRKSPTIKDIAKMAGVSAGTVDRVLHNRGRVSDDSLQKVNKVLTEIDYKPNLIARTLGSNKTFHIAVLIPDPGQDPYWAQSRSGVRQAEIEWLHYNVVIDLYFFDLYDNKSLEEKSNAAFHTKPDGILVAPIFYHEIMPFFELFRNHTIPFVFVNTRLLGVQPLSFIGQDLYQSGRLGAELIHINCKDSGRLAVLHINEDSSNGVHLLDKERGFREYFQEKKSTFEIVAPKLGNSESPSFEEHLQDTLKDPLLRGIFVTTSKGAFIVASFLEKNDRTNITLVGYDMLEENLNYLKSGVINFIIHQNPKRQAFLGVNYLAEHLIFNKEVPPSYLLPLEILTKENYQSYVDSEALA